MVHWAMIMCNCPRHTHCHCPMAFTINHCTLGVHQQAVQSHRLDPKMMSSNKNDNYNPNNRFVQPIQFSLFLVFPFGHLQNLKYSCVQCTLRDPKNACNWHLATTWVRKYSHCVIENKEVTRYLPQNYVHARRDLKLRLLFIDFSTKYGEKNKQKCNRWFPVDVVFAPAKSLKHTQTPSVIYDFRFRFHFNLIKS